MHAEGACQFQHSNVVDFVPPSDAKDAAQAAKVEAFQAVFLSSVRRPRFTAVQQRAEDAGLVHLQFGVPGQLTVSPHSLAQLGHDGGGFRDAPVDLHFK